VGEATIRSLAALPDEDLQAATWEFISVVAPECGPTQPLVSRICRTIKNALENTSKNASDCNVKD
jgi:hypothetical protein